MADSFMIVMMVKATGLGLSNSPNLQEKKWKCVLHKNMYFFYVHRPRQFILAKLYIYNLHSALALCLFNEPLHKWA